MVSAVLGGMYEDDRYLALRQRFDRILEHSACIWAVLEQEPAVNSSGSCSVIGKYSGTESIRASVLICQHLESAFIYRLYLKAISRPVSKTKTEMPIRRREALTVEVTAEAVS